MSCKEKLKYTCGRRENARCVFYEIALPDWSSLLSEDCVTLEETTQELYKELSSMREFFDFDNLVEDCVSYVYEDVDNQKLSEVINPITQELCALQDAFQSQGENSICNVSISDCNIDTACLDDECATGLNTIGDLLQALIDKVCELEEQINP